MKRFRLPWIAFTIALLAGCGEPTHMQYDFGRCYAEAFAIQSDLSRTSAEGMQYPLTGVEGLEVRARVEEATTDTEEGLTVEESEE